MRGSGCCLRFIALMACGLVRPQPVRAQIPVLSVPEGPHAPGDTVRVTLANRAEGTIGYNLCTTALERRSGDAWTRVASERICTMELRTLEPRARADYPLALEPDLPSGTYRFRTQVHMPLGPAPPVGVVTKPFHVAAGGAGDTAAPRKSRS